MKHAEHLHALDLEGERGCDHRGALACDIGLTSREMEVLELLAVGLLASSIASRLAVSPRTVHRHLANIYTKMRTHDRLSTVLRAQAMGLLRTNGGPSSCTGICGAR